MRLSTSLIALSSALLLLAVNLAAEQLYQLTDLGGFGGTTVATGINAAGQITGYSTTADGHAHAFLYSGGNMTDLGTLFGNYSGGGAINNAGQVVGVAYPEADLSGNRAVLFSGGGIADLGTLAGGRASYAFGINDAGQITGLSFTAGFSQPHPFLYDGGSMMDLGTLGGGQGYGYGINASGQVVGFSTTAINFGQPLYSFGTHAFLYSGGSMTDLGTLGGDFSIAKAINDAGQIVGAANIAANGQHAFLYSDGVMADLGTLGGTVSIGQGINGWSQVVGSSFTFGNSAEHAFLYRDGNMIDLNDVLTESGIGLSHAPGINDAGQIIANNIYTGRAYLLAPCADCQFSDVPEPGTWWLLLIGLAGCVFTARGRLLIPAFARASNVTASSRELLARSGHDIPRRN